MNIAQIKTVLDDIRSGKIPADSGTAIEARACVFSSGWNTWVADEVAELKTAFLALDH